MRIRLGGGGEHVLWNCEDEEQAWGGVDCAVWRGWRWENVEYGGVSECDISDTTYEDERRDSALHSSRGVAYGKLQSHQPHDLVPGQRCCYQSHSGCFSSHHLLFLYYFIHRDITLSCLLEKKKKIITFENVMCHPEIYAKILKNRKFRCPTPSPRLETGNLRGSDITFITENRHPYRLYGCSRVGPLRRGIPSTDVEILHP